MDTSLSSGDADNLDKVQATATSLARHTHTLDDRLTLLQVRMVYVSLAFGLACFWFALVYLQLVNENGMWKPKGIHQPSLVVGLFEVGLVIVSGLVYFWGQWAGLYARKFANLTLGLWVAAFLGLAAVGFHIYELHDPGFPLQTGYSSVFIATEGVFTALLTVSVIVLFGLANRARLRKFDVSGIAVEAYGEFWGFIAGVALFNFLALYVQPFFHSGG